MNAEKYTLGDLIDQIEQIAPGKELIIRPDPNTTYEIKELYGKENYQINRHILIDGVTYTIPLKKMIDTQKLNNLTILAWHESYISLKNLSKDKNTLLASKSIVRSI